MLVDGVNLVAVGPTEENDFSYPLWMECISEIRVLIREVDACSQNSGD